jgi:hypothetical protein
LDILTPRWCPCLETIRVDAPTRFVHLNNALVIRNIAQNVRAIIIVNRRSPFQVRPT